MPAAEIPLLRGTELKLGREHLAKENQELKSLCYEGLN